MVKGVPESFLADISTGNLATATSLDRPTETIMLELQQEWVEDLTVIAKYVLSVSKGAPSGKLREASGLVGDINVKVNFPAVREGDTPALITGIVQSMTLGNRGGQIVGIDEKEGVMKLAELAGIEDPAEMAERMYPSKGPDKYDPNRTKDILPPPIPTAPPINPGGRPQDPGGKQERPPAERPAAEAMRTSAHRLLRALKLMETESDDND
jgi:hypothetical protein